MQISYNKFSSGAFGENQWNSCVHFHKESPRWATWTVLGKHCRGWNVASSDPPPTALTPVPATPLITRISGSLWFERLCIIDLKTLCNPLTAKPNEGGPPGGDHLSVFRNDGQLSPIFFAAVVFILCLSRQLPTGLRNSRGASFAFFFFFF